jgi:hypothetical protein
MSHTWSARTLDAKLADFRLRVHVDSLGARMVGGRSVAIRVVPGASCVSEASVVSNGVLKSGRTHIPAATLPIVHRVARFLPRSLRELVRERDFELSTPVFSADDLNRRLRGGQAEDRDGGGTIVIEFPNRSVTIMPEDGGFTMFRSSGTGRFLVPDQLLPALAVEDAIALVAQTVDELHGQRVVSSALLPAGAELDNLHKAMTALKPLAIWERLATALAPRLQDRAAIATSPAAGRADAALLTLLASAYKTARPAEIPRSLPRPEERTTRTMTTVDRPEAWLRWRTSPGFLSGTGRAPGASGEIVAHRVLMTPDARDLLLALVAVRREVEKESQPAVRDAIARRIRQPWLPPASDPEMVALVSR